MRIPLILGILMFIFSFSITSISYAAGKENNLNNQERKTENRQARTVGNVSIEVEDDSDLDENDKEEKEVKAKGDKPTKDEESRMGEQRRSQVANAVHQMLQVADRVGGIGQQVRVIAQSQQENHEEVEAKLEKIKERSGFAKFFIGPKYDEITKAKELIKQDKDKIKNLEDLESVLTNEEDKAKITEQIEVIKKAMTEVENIVGEEQKGFSLFGWLAKIF